MTKRDIRDGETYLFVATDSPVRKHLEGHPFTVAERRFVFRKFRGQRTQKHLRFFNDDGVGARAEELEPLPPEYHAWDLLNEAELATLVARWRDGTFYPDEPENTPF